MREAFLGIALLLAQFCDSFAKFFMNFLHSGNCACMLWRGIPPIGRHLYRVYHSGGSPRKNMRGEPARTRRILYFAIALSSGMAGHLAAENSFQTSSGTPSGLSIHRIQAALAKFDPNFTTVTDSNFVIVSDDLRVTVKADDAVHYDGTPYHHGAPQSGLYGPVVVSDKFYGVERLLHYSLVRGNAPYGGIELQEHITILYETMHRKPFRPRVFDSKPFVINKDGTFQDRQVLGRFDTPWPETTLQVIKQELIVDGELVATVYIVRTPKDIRVVGYSVPPLVPGLWQSGAVFQ
jgi:hypothetical protein